MLPFPAYTLIAEADCNQMLWLVPLLNANETLSIVLFKLAPFVFVLSLLPALQLLLDAKELTE